MKNYTIIEESRLIDGEMISIEGGIFCQETEPGSFKTTCRTDKVTCPNLYTNCDPNGYNSCNNYVGKPLFSPEERIDID